MNMNATNPFNTSLNSARRIGQTTLAIHKAGWRWLRDRKQPLPHLVRDTVEELGATYIKLGQLIASSPSLFPYEYVEAFQTCLDQTPPLPFKTIEKVLRQELGKNYMDLFQRIDPTPLASASIAQVHAATWHNGDEVVIKVQKPDVERILETDFQFMNASARLLEMISPNIPESSITDMVEEIRNGMLEECDFMQEAKNIHAFGNFLREANIDHVVVPRVYLQGTKKRVLTMERFFGAPLSDIEKVRQYSPDPEETLISALNTWFLSLTSCQIYHADLHAGNVMILEDGRVGFIDFGIVGRISPAVWEALLTLMAAVPAQDYLSIAESLIAIGATDSDINASWFARDLKDLIETLERGDFGHGEPEDFLTGVTLKMSELGRKHGIRFPREFTLLVKQFLYFDRYIRLMAPELAMFEDERVLLKPYIQ